MDVDGVYPLKVFAGHISACIPIYQTLGESQRQSSSGFAIGLTHPSE
jgi:hypothetical protein